MTAPLILGEPANGCEPLQNRDVAGKVVFFDRGGCSFARKVINAQDKDAGFVIIANYETENAESLVLMGASAVEATEVLLPSASVSYATGVSIKSLPIPEPIVTVDSRDYIPAHDRAEKPMSAFVLPTLVTVASIFSLMLATVFVMYLSDRCKLHQLRTYRIRVLANLGTKRFVAPPPAQVSVDDSSAGDTEGDVKCPPATGGLPVANGTYGCMECLICISDFENGDELTVLPCGHEFHATCIRPWLVDNSSVCPKCRSSVLEVAAQGIELTPSCGTVICGHVLPSWTPPDLAANLGVPPGANGSLVARLAALVGGAVGVARRAAQRVRRRTDGIGLRSRPGFSAVMSEPLTESASSVAGSPRTAEGEDHAGIDRWPGVANPSADENSDASRAAYNGAEVAAAVEIAAIAPEASTQSLTANPTDAETAMESKSGEDAVAEAAGAAEEGRAAPGSEGPAAQARITAEDLARIERLTQRRLEGLRGWMQILSLTTLIAVSILLLGELWANTDS